MSDGQLVWCYPRQSRLNPRAFGEISALPCDNGRYSGSNPDEAMRGGATIRMRMAPGSV
jgi:hypothetical protein